MERDYCLATDERYGLLGNTCTNRILPVFATPGNGALLEKDIVTEFPKAEGYQQLALPRFPFQNSAHYQGTQKSLACDFSSVESMWLKVARGSRCAESH